MNSFPVQFVLRSIEKTSLKDLELRVCGIFHDTDSFPDRVRLRNPGGP